ncbi:MAG: hypothetical protein AAFY76_06665 [Cyanobacteria bacterium J06649_11]
MGQESKIPSLKAKRWFIAIILTQVVSKQHISSKRVKAIYKFDNNQNKLAIFCIFIQQIQHYGSTVDGN